ncbi:hypothetical protein RUND412_001129 [Rhizina undulata]
MEDARNDIVPQNSPDSRKRVARACERCKRQKLRCDSYRPCALCVRAGKTCIPSQLHPRRPRTRTTTEKRVLSNDQAVLPTVASPKGRLSSPSPTVSGISHIYTQNTPSLSPPILLPTPDTLCREVLIETKTSRLVNLLPTKLTTRFLSSVYFERINWYTLLLHQGLFTFDLEKILAVLGRGSELEDSAANFSFMAILILIIATGALCMTKDPELVKQFEALGEEAGEIENFVERVLECLSQCYLDVVELESLESVQVCVLLGQLHVHYTRRHRLATECFATGVRIAGILRLEKKDSSKRLRVLEGAKEEDVDLIKRELSMDQFRKRVFWTLFEVERTVSLYYGGSIGIIYWEREANDYEEIKCLKPRRWYSVTEWKDDVDPADEDDGTSVTLLEFRKRSVELWILIGEILERVYGVNRRTTSAGFPDELEEKVKKYRERLEAWHESLHPCLRLPNHTQPLSPSPPPHSPLWEQNIFRLQSLALQITFNNALLILFRPLLPYPSIYPDAIQTCLSNAFQLSDVITKHPQLVNKAVATHMTIMFGPYLFMAGMVLHSIAAMNPTGPEAQGIRQAIYRVLESLRRIEDWERVALLQKVLEGTVKREFQKMIYGFPEVAVEDDKGENRVFREIMEELRKVCSTAMAEVRKEIGVPQGRGGLQNNFLEMEQLWMWFKLSPGN